MAGALTGSMFLAGEQVAGLGEPFHAINPATGHALDPGYPAATSTQVAAAASAAGEAFAAYRSTTPQVRATFLRSIADRIDADPELVDRVHAETGILPERIVMERARTSNQLRLFADVVNEGSYLGVRIDHGDTERRPLPKPDLRHRFIPVGPVAVFGASNFPLAFSVAGGDTASALAAGCPVVVKAHEAHPGTSEIVGRIIAEAVAEQGLPAGTFSLVTGPAPEVGLALVTHPAIRAVGFTGSRRAGLALTTAAQNRAVPIPVYAEMASINPIFVLPGAAAARAGQIGTGLVASALSASGQLCTSPGLVFLPEGPDADALVVAAAAAIANAPSGCMLTPGIATSFEAGVARFAAVPGVRPVARATPDPSLTSPCTPTLFETDLATFRDHLADLTVEVFGSVTLIVRVPNETADWWATLLPLLEGQLTATIHIEPTDREHAIDLLAALEVLAGRIIVNGFPTGVEVNDAVIHGGPYPATTAPATTSVGTRAIERFLRPVAYQDVPGDLLPVELRDETTGLWRRVDGTFTR
ncbi:MAG: aldehyde dehydrogenase (NADP(+)) [Propionibacteriaceae bacterium]|nr:aldehyde dehydrogenase (NADP(+)) [Propionibacteriaceae bacterium]